jgi:hypothetical protein
MSVSTYKQDQIAQPEPFKQAYPCLQVGPVITTDFPSLEHVVCKYQHSARAWILTTPNIWLKRFFNYELYRSNAFAAMSMCSASQNTSKNGLTDKGDQRLSC